MYESAPGRTRRPFSLLSGIIIFFAGITLFLPAALSSPPSAPSPVNLHQDTLVFGGSRNYPPFEWLDARGKPRGFLIEIENALADHGGVRTAHRHMKWSEVLNALQSGEIDAVPMFVTPGRQERFIFTEPIYHLTHGIFTRRDGPAVSRPEQLRDKRVAVVAGGYAHEQLQNNPAMPPVKLIKAEDIGHALRKIDAGLADYAILARHTARHLISRHQHAVAQTSPPLWPRSYAFAVRKDNPELHAWLQHHLAMIQINGTYRTIYDRWDEQLEWSTPGLADLFKQYAWLLSALATIIVLVSAWSWLLKKQVRQRTVQLSNELQRRKKAEAELEYQAHHDPLTGLTNRQQFIRRLEQIGRDNKDAELSVATIQINGIDDVILHLGYKVGEDMLQAFADRLRTTRLDVLAHLGNGQYAIGRSGSMPPDKLVSCIQDTLQLDYMEIDPRFSIGLTHGRVDEQHPGEMLRQASVALAAAMQRRRPWLEYSRDIEPDRRAIQLLRDYWRDGTRDFQACFHPQVDLQSNRIIGAEALARWHHPSMGLLNPDRFIPMLEKSGLIYRLTEEMITQAVQFSSKRRMKGSPCPVSVNVAVSDLVEHDLASVVRQTLERYHADERDLRLEMTETGLVSEPSRVRWILEELQNMGIVCEIDDFGTGYSSISYLSDFPVNGIKIERMFVGSMCSDQRLRSIVNSTINLAHELDLHVVAEGPEDNQTLDILREYECDYAQGYIYTPPLTQNDFTDFIDNWSSQAT